MIKFNFKWEETYFGDKTSNIICPVLEKTKIYVGSISCTECKNFTSLTDKIANWCEVKCNER